jgi:prepilin-type N-terminal cleavage/methylation domain-containing protein
MQQKNNVRLQKVGLIGSKKISRRASAFTLTELLVVIAITAILMGLLFIPIIGGLQSVKRAQGESVAQASVRSKMDSIMREIEQAAHVYDNTATPITLPLQDPSPTAPVRPNLEGIIGFTPANTIQLSSTGRTNLLFGKLDLLPVATQDALPSDAADPTVGGTKLGGSTIRLPLAPGTKVVRYFLGLKRNTNAAGNGRAYYQNRYEFPKTDQDFNPFVLYRVEFDPYDPDLIRPVDTDGDGKPDSPDLGMMSAALNDPDFFYNLAEADTDIYWSLNSPTPGALRKEANGRTYAQNWKAKATIVLDGDKMDLLLWRHKRRGDINEGNPFGTAVSFAPASIAAETAVPDTLSSPNAETPKSVPTSYKTQYGNWTTPFKVTFQRGAGDGSVDGNLTVEFYNQPTGGGLSPLMTRIENAYGQLVTAPANFYVGYLRSSNKFFVKTNNLTCAIDPVRGRIETAFPSLAGDSGAPYITNGANPPRMVPGFDPFVANNVGDLIPTTFNAMTRDNRTSALPPGTVPVNKGIESANLLADQDPIDENNPAGPKKVSASYLYYLPDGTGVVNAAPTVNFGNVMIIPGSEQVTGPDLVVTANSPTGTSLIPYHRVATNLGSVQKLAGLDTTSNRYLNRNGELDYRLDDDKLPLLGRLVFDEGDSDTGLAGLPASTAADDAVTMNPSLLKVTYLWQNNYARNAAGEPLNANGVALSTIINGKPDGDIVRVDYSTRAILSINFGARVYVSDGAEPQTVQVTEKVKINNLGR